MSQIKIITKITYNTGYEAASETPYIGDMEFVNLNMEDARQDRPAIVIDGFDGEAGNTTGIRFNNIRVADGATIALKDCAGISFHNVLTTEEKKPVYKVANAQGISH